MVTVAEKDCDDDKCSGIAEDDCDDEECGGEEKGPVKTEKSNLLFGLLDTRPLLPPLLAFSTFAGWLCVTFVEVPLFLIRFKGMPFLGAQAVSAALHGTTLSCMVFCIFASPGMVPEGTDEDDLPERAKKTWNYPRAVLRYDHYCRWLTNSIGLLNHRPFFVMVSGLYGIGCLLAVVDLILLTWAAVDGAAAYEPRRQYNVQDAQVVLPFIPVVLHFAYCLALVKFVGPIFFTHVRLISHGELAKDLVNEAFLVIKGTDRKVIDWESGDESIASENKEYGEHLNKWDQGCWSNCLTFWCTSRSDSLGEF